MNTNQLARIASLIGEPARTAMLETLLDGRAFTAGELSAVACVSPATTSRHLALLLDAQLIHVRPQGRHRYYQLASPDVARVLESMMQLARPHRDSTAVHTGPREAAMRFARTCYDHLAGRLAVGICDHLVEAGAVSIQGDMAVLTSQAGSVLRGLGVSSLPEDGRGQRLACRPCLDWSERRTHIAGQLGSMLCAHALQQGWLMRKPRSRALELTPRGARSLRDALGARRWSEIAS